VGQALADRLRRPFADLDRVIEAEAGRSTSIIFLEESEAGFRAREARCLQRVLSDDGRVVSVGSSAPLDATNWQTIRNGNCVVALLAQPAELEARLRGGMDRPLLRQGVGPALTSLLPARMHRYLEADLIVPTDGRAPEAIAGAIAEALPEDGLERIEVNVHGAPHEIVIGTRLHHLVAGVLTRKAVVGVVAVITHDVVGPRHGATLVFNLPRARVLRRPAAVG
jgi:shikimate kinase